MKNLKLAAPLAISLLLMATSAFAAPVTWTIPSTTVGASTISGTFVYDSSLPETERLVSINITEAGPYQSTYAFNGLNHNLYLMGQKTSAVSLSDRVIRIIFVDVLGESGGSRYVNIIAGNCSIHTGGICHGLDFDFEAVDVVISSPYPPAIPTMSEWAMILFGAFLVGGAGLTILRRRTVKQGVSA